MGCDCINFIPAAFKPSKIIEFLEFVGYRLQGKKKTDEYVVYSMTFFEFIDYKYKEGVSLEIYDFGIDREIEISTHTSIWRSADDTDFHNYTIKKIKERFGGWFHSDYGRNRYFKISSDRLSGAEAGVLYAYESFCENLKTITMITNYLENNNEGVIQTFDGEFSFLNKYNPKVMIANILIPYVISLTEEFFRASHIALLRYSSVRDKIISSSNRLGSDELVRIQNKEMDVCEAISKWLNFQEISKVSSHFCAINKKIDVSGVFRKYKRNKLNGYDLFSQFIERRHDLIHRASYDHDYTKESIIRDIKDINNLIGFIYLHIASVNGWDVDKYRNVSILELPKGNLRV